MPNLMMEYSHSVDERVNIQKLLEDLHQVAIESGLFEVSSVKSRAISCHDWLIGEEADSQDFIHITFELLSGRTLEQKKELANQLMQVLKEQVGPVRSLTINVRDMDLESFLKVTN